MNRDAINAAAKAISKADPDAVAFAAAAAAVDAVDPIIRANERKRIALAIEEVAVGWVQYQRMPENTTHIAYVHENGAVYDPERGWLSFEDALMDHADPLISRDAAAAIATKD